MALWKFLGELALFDIIRRWFSSQQPVPIPPVIPKRNTNIATGSFTRNNVDELQDRLNQLESELDDCDIMSDRYDDLQDRIDTLTNRLDEIGYDDYSDDHDYSDDIDYDF